MRLPGKFTFYICHCGRMHLLQWCFLSVATCSFIVFSVMDLKDKSSISFSMGSADIWCRWSICNDGRLICCPCGGFLLISHHFICHYSICHCDWCDLYSNAVHWCIHRRLKVRKCDTIASFCSQPWYWLAGIGYCLNLSAHWLMSLIFQHIDAIIN